MSQAAARVAIAQPIVTAMPTVAKTWGHAATGTKERLERGRVERG